MGVNLLLKLLEDTFTVERPALSIDIDNTDLFESIRIEMTHL